MKRLYRLQDTTTADLPLVGGKAVSLGELIRAGFPVPEGFVISTQMMGDLDMELTRAFQLLNADGATLFAVRSSANVEDTTTASCAGMHDTFLNVPGFRVEEFIVQCVASLLSPRAVKYRMESNLAGAQMGVIVQLMVNAKAGGVMMTCDPLSGDTSKIMIEAVLGSGAGLVSGEVTPDQFVVGKTDDTISETIAECDGNPSITIAQVQQLKSYALKIERHFGCTQEIEWAIDPRGNIAILQSRPIAN